MTKRDKHRSGMVSLPPPLVAQKKYLEVIWDAPGSYICGAKSLKKLRQSWSGRMELERIKAWTLNTNCFFLHTKPGLFIVGVSLLSMQMVNTSMMLIITMKNTGTPWCKTLAIDSPNMTSPWKNDAFPTISPGSHLMDSLQQRRPEGAGIKLADLNLILGELTRGGQDLG